MGVEVFNLEKRNPLSKSSGYLAGAESPGFLPYSTSLSAPDKPRGWLLLLLWRRKLRLRMLDGSLKSQDPDYFGLWCGFPCVDVLVSYCCSNK